MDIFASHDKGGDVRCENPIPHKNKNESLRVIYDSDIYVLYGRLSMIRPFFYDSAVQVLLGRLSMIWLFKYDSAIFVRLGCLNMI